MSKYVYGDSPALVKASRTRFDVPIKSVKTSMSVGKLYPIAWEEVLPGDTWKQTVSSVTLLTSSYLRPPQDGLIMDTITVFCPLRLLYEDYERVFGNPNPSAYSDPALKGFPLITGGRVESGTVGDYLELPIGFQPNEKDAISVAPFRAFALFYDQWVRNQNVSGEMVVQKGEYQASEAPNNKPWAPDNYTGQLPNVSKLKDYFTTATPAPQKGAPVQLNTLGGLQYVRPVRANDPESELPGTSGKYNATVNYKNLDSTGSNFTDFPVRDVSLYLSSQSFSPEQGFLVGTDLTDNEPGTMQSYPVPVNLAVDLSTAGTIPVSDARLAFALQRMQEQDIFGGRYREYILSHFGVKNGDARMQVPEYLAGKRTPLFSQTIVQTSQATEESPLGQLAGYSETIQDKVAGFTKSFSEHGILLTVACIRQIHTYSQGIAPKWRRSVREDFYDPCFAHISNQPIYRSEIYAESGGDYKEHVFGYKEAWTEYKRFPSLVTGQARPTSDKPLDLYHFADNYSSAPVLSKEFIDETPVFVDRTLSVPSTSLDSFFVDFAFKTSVTRRMPMHCTPGLIDHIG